MNQEAIYTLVLRPDHDLENQLVHFSQEISSEITSEVVLGEHAIPHITIAQWTQTEFSTLREAVKTLTNYDVGTLTLAGVTVLPDPNGLNWVEIPVLSTAALRDLQNAALQATKGQGKIVSGMADNYRPHITVGLTPKTQISLPQFSRTLLRTSSNNWTVHLGACGKNFTVISLLN